MGQSCGSMGLASRNNLLKMTTDNANRSNAARRTKATTKTGLVSLLVLCLLTEGYAKTTLNLPTRFRRQVDEEEQAEDDFGTVLTRFLTADAETQQDYIRYGLELAEYHLLESYDGVKDKTDETDRVFLESVQSVIDALRQINTDPARTPTALAELATNPDNLLLFTSLVVTTVFVAQLSSFVLFGSSLSAPLQEDAGPVSGLLGIMMELFNVFPNLLATIGDIVGNIARGASLILSSTCWPASSQTQPEMVTLRLTRTVQGLVMERRRRWTTTSTSGWTWSLAACSTSSST